MIIGDKMIKTVSQNQTNEIFLKIKQIDKFAKDLGFTIYRLDYGYTKNNTELIHSIDGLNKPSERYLNFVKSVETVNV